MIMRVCINGQWQDRTESTVAELLAALRFESRRCAVERNRRLVPRAQHAETGLQENDELEIVTLVGGG